jgi:cysteine sulfinate desulfinase/cysteine desulfurase-like protein
MLSIVKHSKNPPEICNSQIKEKLEKNGIIVSIGSACNTASPYASHVVNEIKLDSNLKKGVLRISLADYNHNAQILKFIKVFLNIIAEYNT